MPLFVWAGYKRDSQRKEDSVQAHYRHIDSTVTTKERALKIIDSLNKN